MNLILCGPSGVGKTTLISKFLELNPEFVLTISCTTRLMRANEEAGREYYFISKEKFEEMLLNDRFLEITEYQGNFYGTDITQISHNQNSILNLDLNGIKKFKSLDYSVITVLIIPPSIPSLIERLKSRNETEKNRFIYDLEQEFKDLHLFDYIITNDNLEETLNFLQQIVLLQKQKSNSINCINQMLLNKNFN